MEAINFLDLKLEIVYRRYREDLECVREGVSYWVELTDDSIIHTSQHTSLASALREVEQVAGDLRWGIHGNSIATGPDGTDRYAVYIQNGDEYSLWSVLGLHRDVVEAWLRGLV